jgi:hypothetical protein
MEINLGINSGIVQYYLGQGPLPHFKAWMKLDGFN